MTWVGALKIQPPSTVQRPWRFDSFMDAKNFARISERKVYAVILSLGAGTVFEIYPGGRAIRHEGVQ